VQLKQFVGRLGEQLDHDLLEHGANVSVGERQLICLSRELLQQNKIVILDEPFALVDPDTAQTIWNVVREKLMDSTVIHRLNTIDLIHKWRLINYSFAFMLIILTSLVCTNKIQKNFCFKVRLVWTISIKTEE